MSGNQGEIDPVALLRIVYGKDDDDRLQKAVNKSKSSYVEEQKMRSQLDKERLGRDLVKICDEVNVSLSERNSLQVLESKCGCALKLTRYGLAVSGRSPEGLDRVKDYVKSAAASVGTLNAAVAEAKRTRIHIFVDISNIVHGVPVHDAMLDIEQIKEIISGGREVGSAYAFGSYQQHDGPPKWKRYWEKHFETHLTPRTNREVSVDEMVHSAVLRQMLNDKDVVVLVTGDGNTNGDRPTSFYDCVTAGLKNDIPVEVWSWKAACANSYMRLYNEKRITLRFLDSFLERVLHCKLPPTAYPRTVLL